MMLSDLRLSTLCSSSLLSFCAYDGVVVMCAVVGRRICVDGDVGVIVYIAALSSLLFVLTCVLL